MAILTPTQFKRSLALANAYGHLWARETTVMIGVRRRASDYLNEELPPLKFLCDLEIEDTSPYLNTDFLAALSHASEAGQLPGGIVAPEVDASGNVVHTTFSGRLTWVIEPDGVTTLTISRPCGDVLRAVVAFDRYSYLDILDHQNVHRRHINALMDALSALSEQITWKSGDHGVRGLGIFEQSVRLYSSIAEEDEE